MFSSKGGIDKASILKMRDSMTHRGPDASGIWLSPRKDIALAHRRLSIIDLSESSNQPMIDQTGSFIITFNGEIYNFIELRNHLNDKGYSFFTSSDTEVILAAYQEWGKDCVNKLNGMFAFCIYDKLQNELFLARDRAGEKPLYYYLEDGIFIFSSELKPLMSYESFIPTANPTSLDCYLSLGYVPGDLCILENVKKLPPAHAMSFNLNQSKLNSWRYWSLPEKGDVDQDNLDKESLLDELESLVEDSVQKQLMSDVPIGVLLSGGVDSSLVTAMAVRGGKRIKTFTVRFPGYEEFDETNHARLIADHFGTDHQELSADSPSPELLFSLARQFDEPMIDSSMIPTFLVSQLIKKHCTVALGGDGGDELFGGYSHHSRLLWTHSKAKYMPYYLRKLISEFSAFIPIGFRGRSWLQGLSTDFNKSLPLVASHFDRSARSVLFRNIMSSLNAEAIREERIPSSSDLLDRATKMDFENYLPEDILVKIDRSSMLNSLEIRAPLLDYRIIEFAFSRIPSSLKTNSNSRKILLKDLCRRIFPSSFDYKRKQGFSIPLGAWLKDGPWLDFFTDILQGSDLFEQKMIASLLLGQKRGFNNSERLFGLVMLELWKREYDIQFV